MWDLPGPGLKPVSPALAGGFLTTVPPGKSLYAQFNSRGIKSWSQENALEWERNGDIHTEYLRVTELYRKFSIIPGNSPTVHWLGLHVFTAEDPGRGSKIPQAVQCGQKKKKKQKKLALFPTQYILAHTPPPSPDSESQKGTLPGNFQLGGEWE